MKLAKTAAILLITPVIFLLSHHNLNAFWYNDFEAISGYMSDEKKVELHEYITQKIIPELDDNLYLNDNIYGDSGVTIYKRDKAYNGYTLLSTVRGKSCTSYAPGDMYFKRLNLPTCNAILIDMNGNVVREWPLIAFPAEMTPGGNVIGAVINRPDVIAGMPLVMEMDYCGNSKWTWQGEGTPLIKPETQGGWGGGARFHHDIQRSSSAVYHSPNLDIYDNSGPLGKRTLVLSNHDQRLSSGLMGIEVEWSNFPLQDDALFEVSADGKSVLWSWYPAEHMEQLGFDDAAKYGIKTIRSTGIGGPPEGEPGPTDWLHINTANYVGSNKWYDQGDLRFHPDNIMIDSRTSNFIAIIARYDHPKGLWQSGDIVWRVGPGYGKGHQENSIGQIIGPHFAHLIPRGLQGAGNILVFDNGGLAGYGLVLPGLPPEYGTYPATIRDYSRVIEFNPITLEKVWEYKCPVEKKVDEEVVERKFYSRLISGSQRLPNGNTLITEGQSGRVFEVTKKLEIVWEFINPYYDGAFLIGPATFLPQNAVYRAYRIPYSWSKTCP